MKALGGRTSRYVLELLIVYHRPSISFTHTGLGLSAPELWRKTLKYPCSCVLLVTTRLKLSGDIR